MDRSLNPALAESRFCPRCQAPAEIDFPRRLECPACGYIAFHNPKPVSCAIPVTPSGEILLLRRGFDPGKGLWTFPGGFVDLGETVEQAAEREAMEELGIAVELGALVGVYSRPDTPIVLVVFAARTADEPQTTPEAIEVGAFVKEALPWDEMAFWSTNQALLDFVAQRAKSL